MTKEQGLRLQQMDLQERDVVRCVRSSSKCLTQGKEYTVQPDGSILNNYGTPWWASDSRFVKVTPNPKPWAEMTPEERAAIPQDVLDDPTNPHCIPWTEWPSKVAKGLVLLAWCEGRAVEYLAGGEHWLTEDDHPRGWGLLPRRIPPAPVRKTVELKADGTDEVWCRVQVDADGKRVPGSEEWVK